MLYGKKGPVVRKKMASEVPEIMHGPKGQNPIVHKSAKDLVDENEESESGMYHSSPSESKLPHFGSNLLHEQDGMHHEGKGFLASKM